MLHFEVCQRNTKYQKISCKRWFIVATIICFSCLGPLCSVCVNRFGCRPVMLVGGLFASMGMVIASFCTSIVQIYLTAGVITGKYYAENQFTYVLALG